MPDADPNESNKLTQLASFDVGAALLDEDNDCDAWEVINRALDNAMGFGCTSDELAAMVRRGEHGMLSL